MTVKPDRRRHRVLEAPRAPDQGGTYRFTFPISRSQQHAKLGVGVGDVDLEELEDYKVSVEMNRYDQPKGPGTAFSVQPPAGHVEERAVYIEFAGRAKAANGDHYAFRVNLGAAIPVARAKVQPADDKTRTAASLSEDGRRASTDDDGHHDDDAEASRTCVARLSLVAFW